MEVKKKKRGRKPRKPRKSKVSKKKESLDDFSRQSGREEKERKRKDKKLVKKKRKRRKRRGKWTIEKKIVSYVTRHFKSNVLIKRFILALKRQSQFMPKYKPKPMSCRKIQVNPSVFIKFTADRFQLGMIRPNTRQHNVLQNEEMKTDTETEKTVLFPHSLFRNLDRFKHTNIEYVSSIYRRWIEKLNKRDVCNLIRHIWIKYTRFHLQSEDKDEIDLKTLISAKKYSDQLPEKTIRTTLEHLFDLLGTINPCGIIFLFNCLHSYNSNGTTPDGGKDTNKDKQGE